MPKQRERFIKTAVFVSSFYDPKVQKVLETRRDALPGWPVFVHRQIDLLVRRSGGRPAGESLLFEEIFLKDSDFASDVFRVLDDYHRKSPFKHSLSRVLLERSWSWLSIAEGAPKNDRPWSSKEIAQNSTSLFGREVPEVSIRNNLSRLRREVKKTDASWEEHIRPIEELKKQVFGRYPESLPYTKNGRALNNRIQEEVKTTVERYFLETDLFAHKFDQNNVQ